ncbi:hypothetical protein OROGR_012465 [Orobanche gracilis]
MDFYAEASCILKVNVHCQSCKMRILEVLGSICGEYNIDINTEEGLVRVYALVEPNLLMRALARTGYHAELVRVKLQHPKLNRNYYHDSYNYRYGNGHCNYQAINDPYDYGRALPDPISYSSHQNYPTRRRVAPNYHGSDPYYYYGSTSTQARIMWSNACRRPRPFGF